MASAASLAALALLASAAPTACGFPTVTFSPDATATTTQDSASATGGAGGTPSSTTTMPSSSTSSGGAAQTSTSSTASTSPASSGGSGGGGGGMGGGGQGGQGGSSTGDGGFGGSNCLMPCDCDGDGHKAVGACGGDDCADEDPRAYPGETKKYVTPIVGHRSAGTLPFDFNCDGSETNSINTAVDCSSGCSSTEAWKGSVPMCGDPGQTAHCKVVNLVGCEEVDDATTTQACN